jgi:hypothetical protein
VEIVTKKQPHQHPHSLLYIGKQLPKSILEFPLSRSLLLLHTIAVSSESREKSRPTIKATILGSRFTGSGATNSWPGYQTTITSNPYFQADLPNMTYRDEYRHWPFLTEEEFALACAFFDQRYIKAKLGPTRKILKIISRRTATTGGTYIEILRLLQPPKDDDDLALALESLSGFGSSAKDEGMDVDMANDDHDQVCGISFSFMLHDKFADRITNLFRRYCGHSCGRNQIAHHPNTVFIPINLMSRMRYISIQLIECQLYGSPYMTYRWETQRLI